MRFVLKRLALFVVALFGLSVVVFAALRILPGDVASVMAGVHSQPERVTQLREQLGLNRPLIAQYFDWMSALARGDFGTSILTGRSVTSLVGARASITFPLIILGLLIALAIGLPSSFPFHWASTRPFTKIPGLTQEVCSLPCCSFPCRSSGWACC